MRKDTTKESHTQVWSVCGGKGGVGKTFLSANLGILLADEKGDVTVVDADLGTPNLHTHLGVRKPKHSLGDFVYRRVPKLTDIVEPTSIPKLRFVPGSKNDLFTANLKYGQKRRLINQIQRLEGSHVVLDLAAGADFNTLDFLRESDIGIIVANPDPASVESAYDFLRATVLRVLEFRVRALRNTGQLLEVTSARHGGPRSIRELLQEVRSKDSEFATLLAGELERLRLFLVINRAKGEAAEVLGRMMVDAVNEWIEVQLHFLGAVPYDPAVEETLCGFEPYVLANPNSRTSYSLRLIAGRLLAATNGNHT
ncbi:MAG: P-loop NTPase [Acidobacteriota bacterium]|nr:MAG: P-loop NTPase [Acidobacteriota bacterium]